MEINELAKALRKRSIDPGAGPDCLGCGFEDNCCILGCRMMNLAADELERLQAIAMDPDSVSRTEKQAVFRLGQMDMQQSILLMLQDLAENASGLVASTILDISSKVEDMPVGENTA